MRVLFATWAWPSHLYAMVPLAWACQAAGHEVRVASQPRLRDVIEATGLTAVSVGHDVDAVGMVRTYVIPSEAVPAPAEPAKPSGQGGPRALQMFYAHAESMAADLADFARDWRADVVVSEPTAWAGPIAAAAAGVPAVRHLYGTDLVYRAKDLAPQVTKPITDELGIEPVDSLGAATIDPWPGSLQFDTDYRRLPVRYVPFNGSGGVPPAALAGNAGRDRPRVCVTWGHTIAQLDPALFFAGDVVRAIADIDAEVVVAVSADQEPMLGDLPEGVRVAVDVPLGLLLESSDLLIAHGGAGSILTGLHHGVPQLLVPQLPDHAGHAGQLLKGRAGEVLTRDEATPKELLATTEELLGNPRFREAARRLRDELREQPPPAALVPALERIAADGAA